MSVKVKYARRGALKTPRSAKDAAESWGGAGEGGEGRETRARGSFLPAKSRLHLKQRYFNHRL